MVVELAEMMHFKQLIVEKEIFMLVALVPLQEPGQRGQQELVLVESAHPLP